MPVYQRNTGISNIGSKPQMSSTRFVTTVIATIADVIAKNDRGTFLRKTRVRIRVRVRASVRVKARVRVRDS
jgi:hypothetical protein